MTSLYLWRQQQRERNRVRGALKIRFVGRALGVPAQPVDDRYTRRLILASHLAISASPAGHDDERIRWTAYFIGRRRGYSHSDLSITSDNSRSVHQLAADVQRRLVPRARAWADEEATKEAAYLQDQRAKDAQVRQLERILGPLPLDHHERSHHGEAFAIARHDLNGGSYRGVYTLRVSPHSWACVLSIAHLIAEDTRRAAATAEAFA